MKENLIETGLITQAWGPQLMMTLLTWKCLWLCETVARMSYFWTTNLLVVRWTSFARVLRCTVLLFLTWICFYWSVISSFAHQLGTIEIFLLPYLSRFFSDRPRCTHPFLCTFTEGLFKTFWFFWISFYKTVHNINKHFLKLFAETL